MSLIEEGSVKLIRMANLCIVACHKIIFCSELQAKILLEGPFKDFA
jgi:glucan phosphorylase